MKFSSRNLTEEKAKADQKESDSFLLMILFLLFWKTDFSQGKELPAQTGVSIENCINVRFYFCSANSHGR